MGRAAQEAQPHLRPRARRRVRTAPGAGVAALLRLPRRPLGPPPPRGRAALSAGVRALHGAEQRQLPVLLRGHALRHRGGVGQRHGGGPGGGEREGGIQERRGRFRLYSALRMRGCQSSAAKNRGEKTSSGGRRSGGCETFFHITEAPETTRPQILCLALTNKNPYYLQMICRKDQETVKQDFVASVTCFRSLSRSHIDTVSLFSLYSKLLAIT